MTDRWLRVHPALPAVLFGPLALACLAWAPLRGGGSWLWPALALGALGYLLWTLAEYLLHRCLFHHRALQRLPLGRRLKGYHLRHHFRDDTSGFGVTTRLWDVVFGTLPGRPEPCRRESRRQQGDGSDASPATLAAGIEQGDVPA